ncbi:hypothetical protein [Abyssalbus ytuae]|uniref:Uncharacterized protein n=1 Tax=Abyssalbus ytuae TaxID=2926907 RepID=A0A9E6ZXE0_9FLAO|nr:hypothetical protein [Abyssalbus ytuae]UOB18616.1 hypothetical protein MQE35_04835 [Abyssalbus ytuae]
MNKLNKDIIDKMKEAGFMDPDTHSFVNDILKEQTIEIDRLKERLEDEKEKARKKGLDLNKFIERLPVIYPLATR